MPFFFYGTLMDADVLCAVLGREQAAFRPALLKGYRRVLALGKHYPIVVPDAKACVEGVVVAGVSEEELNALRFYEGINYTVETIGVELRESAAEGVAVNVSVFTPTLLEPSAESWELQRWQVETKPGFMGRLAKTMENYRKTKAPKKPVADP